MTNILLLIEIAISIYTHLTYDLQLSRSEKADLVGYILSNSVANLKLSKYTPP